MRADLAPAIDSGTHRGAIESILVSDDGNVFATVGADDRVRIWHPGSQRPEWTVAGRPAPGPRGRIEAAALHPVDGLLAVAIDDRGPAGQDWSSLLWFCQDCSVVAAYRWPDPIRAVVFDPEGGRLIVASRDRLRALALDGAEARPGVAVSAPDDTPTVDLDGDPSAVAFGHHDGVCRVVVASPETGVRAYDLADGAFTPARFEPLELAGIDRLAVGPGRLAVASRYGPAMICRLDGSDQRLVPDAGSGSAGGLAFNDAGSRLVVGSRGGSRSVVTVHDIDEDLDVGGFRFYDGDAEAVGFLDRGTVVSAGGSTGRIEEWAAWTEWGDGAPDAAIESVGRSVTAVGLHGTQIGIGYEVAGPDSVDDDSSRMAPLSFRFDLARPDLVPERDTDPATGEVAPPALDAFARRRHHREVVDGPASYLEHLAIAGPVEPDDPTRDGGDDADLQPTAAYRIQEHRAPSDPTDGRDRGNGGEPAEPLVPGERWLELGPEPIRLTGHGRWPTSPPSAWTFVGDEAIAVAERDGHLRLLRVGPDGEISGRLLATDAPTLDLVADDRWLVAGGRDQVIRLWAIDELGDLDGDPDDLAGLVPPTLSLFVGLDDEWVLWTPSGFYTASIGGDHNLVYHLDQGEAEAPRIFTCNRFSEQFYRPAVIREILAGATEAEALARLAVPELDPATNLPPSIELDDEIVDDDAVLLVFRVEDVGGPPASRVAVTHKGLPVWEATPGDEDRWEVWVWLDPGPNPIRIIAESQVAKATPIDLVVAGPGDPDPGGDPGPGDDGGEEPVAIGDRPGFTVPGFSGGIGWMPEPVAEPATEVSVGPDVASGATAAAPPGALAVDAFARFRLQAEGTPATELVATADGRELWRATVDGPEWVELAIELPAGAGDEVRVDATRDDTTWTVARAALSLDPTEPPVDGGGAEGGDTGGDTGGGPAGTGVGPEVDDDDDLPPPIDAGVASRGLEMSPNVPGGAGTARPERGSAPLGTSSAPSSPSGRTPRPPRPTEEPPHLFLVSIGVSDLANDGGPLSDLRYAADDAIAIADRFGMARSSTFADVWRRILVDGAATKAAIENALDELDRAVAARVADKRARNVTSRDVALFFFAGHGITEPGRDGGRDRFLMVAHDHDDDRADETGVDFRRIGRTLASLNAEVIVLVDACHSGAALPGVYQPSDPGQLAKQLQLVNDRMLYVMSATTSDEKAWEHELLVPYRRIGRRRARVGHGFFTHAILKKVEEADEANEPLSLVTLIGAVQDQLIRWTDRDGWRHVKQRPKARIEGDEIPRLEIYQRRRAP